MAHLYSIDLIVHSLHLLHKCHRTHPLTTANLLEWRHHRLGHSDPRFCIDQDITRSLGMDSYTCNRYITQSNRFPSGFLVSGLIGVWELRGLPERAVAFRAPPNLFFSCPSTSPSLHHHYHLFPIPSLFLIIKWPKPRRASPLRISLVCFLALSFTFPVADLAMRCSRLSYGRCLCSTFSPFQ